MARRKSIGVFVGFIITAFVLSGSAYAYEVVPVTDGGTIVGKVLFKGDPPEAKIFKVEKNPEVCGEKDRVLSEVTVSNGVLADVVVVFEGVEKGKPYSQVVLQGPPPGSREINGESKEFPGTELRPKTCIFGAFTGVVANGKLIRFANQDPVKHSPHAYEVSGMVRDSMFNRDLEGNGTLEEAVKFKKKKAKAMKIECDQHNHMQNWFYQVESPYFAFSGADGSFKIEQVPPGTYKLIAWHPSFKKVQEQEVKVEASGTVEVTFEFESRRGR